MTDVPKYKYSFVACARWETKYISEWLTYQKTIGFDHVFLYCNDDDPRELYERVLPFVVGKCPFVSFFHWPVQGQQLEIYLDFLKKKISCTEWLIFLDIDEFINLRRFGDIRGFLESFSGDVGAVLLNWAFFGPSGHKLPPEGNVLSSYIRRQEKLHELTKNFVRTDRLRAPEHLGAGATQPFWHCPSSILADGVEIIRANGEDGRGYYERISPAQRSKDLSIELGSVEAQPALVHHYAFRSEAAFHERAERGVGGYFRDQGRWAELAESDGFNGFLDMINEVEDRSLAGFWAEKAEEASMTTIGAARMNSLQSVRVPLSRGKPARQSSISEWSVGKSIEEDAQGAVSSTFTGRGTFHTDLQDFAWWYVDLGDDFGIDEIKIYNRIDHPDIARRASRLAIDIGFSADDFAEVYRRESDEPFGGIDGNPLVFKPNIPIPGRFVRVRLLTRNYLHLDQVEVYGEPLPLALHQSASERVHRATGDHVSG